AFQQDNLRVAFLIARALGLDSDRLAAAIPTLRGLPHRMESLGAFTDAASGWRIEITDNGVSTTPESTVAALRSLGTPEGQRIVLVGGELKRGCDLEALAACASELGWTVAPFGSSSEALAAAARNAGTALLRDATGQDRDTWPDTVEETVSAILEGTALGPDGATSPSSSSLHMLFSPACASFDRYPNFKARARAFRDALAARGWRSDAPEPPPATERSNSRD
ncbi:MAG: hypothetical protein AAGG01_23620, partial [Planctomycetota bacterium]